MAGDSASKAPYLEVLVLPVRVHGHESIVHHEVHASERDDSCDGHGQAGVEPERAARRDDVAQSRNRRTLARKRRRAPQQTCSEQLVSGIATPAPSSQPRQHGHREARHSGQLAKRQRAGDTQLALWLGLLRKLELGLLNGQRLFIELGLAVFTAGAALALAWCNA